MRSRWIIGLVALTLLFVAASQSYANPPTWSLHRAALGVDLKGSIVENGAETWSAFLPGLALSYSATSQLSLAATYERDFTEKLSIGRAGFRFRVAGGGNGDVYIGANVVGYGDEGVARYGIVEPTSWSAAVNGAYPLAWYKNGATLAWGIASGEYDPENDLTMVRVGLRFQLIGGAP